MTKYLIVKLLMVSLNFSIPFGYAAGFFTWFKKIIKTYLAL